MNFLLILESVGSQLNSNSFGIFAIEAFQIGKQLHNMAFEVIRIQEHVLAPVLARVLAIELLQQVRIPKLGKFGEQNSRRRNLIIGDAQFEDAGKLSNASQRLQFVMIQTQFLDVLVHLRLLRHQSVYLGDVPEIQLY